MEKKGKRIKSIQLVSVITLVLIFVLPIMATTALNNNDSIASLDDSPFKTYTIVDPGNGENGKDVLTWEQIILSAVDPVQSAYSSNWLLDIGDTVIIKATTSPQRVTRLNFGNGWDRKNDDPPIGVKNTIIGMPGIVYENICIRTIGDTVLQDLAIYTSFPDSALTFSGLRTGGTPESWYARNYFYYNYPAILTVIGDCSMEAGVLSDLSGLHLPEYGVKELTIDGTGMLVAKGTSTGIRFDYYDLAVDKLDKAVLTINIPVVAEKTGYAGNGDSGLELGVYTARRNGNREFEVNGNGSLTAIIADTANAGPDQNYYGFGNGIRIHDADLTFSGDLKIHAKGLGIFHGLRIDVCANLVFDLTNDAVFEGGGWGSGILIAETPQYSTVNVMNKGAGNMTFRGGAVHGHGIETRFIDENTLALSNSDKGRFIVNGGGYGSGLYLSGGESKTLDISGLNYDLELTGGENAPTRLPEPDPWGVVEGGYLNATYRSSAGLLIRNYKYIIKLGDNNLLLKGGANGGAGIDCFNTSSLTIESTGGQLYALGGKGPFGSGLSPSSALGINGNATINAYGGYNNAGVHCTNSDAKMILGSGISLNAYGGAKAPGMSCDLGNYSVTFSDNTPALSITNSSKDDEIHAFTAQSAGTWELTGATFTSGDENSTNAAISIAPGKTGILQR